jgi:pyridinium-3,5-bisthiocarboxylic acid mononucleotide nickel chelatase
MNKRAGSPLCHRHHDGDAGHAGPVQTSARATSVLPRSAAVGLFIDAPSGAGGDMLVAALCDVGVPWAVITEAIEALGLTGTHVSLVQVHAGAIAALRFCVEVDESVQTERSYAQIRRLLHAARLSEGTRERSLAVFERLARAEAKVHRSDLDAVHFHEVGAVDSLCDVVAACAALDYLGARLSCSPLPMGKGFVECRHGRLPLPAPATVECLVGLQTYPVDVEEELVTPTAAAFLGALSHQCVAWPRGTIRASGWGCGTRVLPDRPNAVRAVLFEPEHHVVNVGG